MKIHKEDKAALAILGVGVGIAMWLAKKNSAPLHGLGQDGSDGYYAGPPPVSYSGYGYGYAAQPYGATAYNPYGSSYGYPYAGSYGGYGYGGYGSGYAGEPTSSAGTPLSSAYGAQACVAAGGDYNSFDGSCSSPGGQAALPYTGATYMPPPGYMYQAPAYQPPAYPQGYPAPYTYPYGTSQGYGYQYQQPTQPVMTAAEQRCINKGWQLVATSAGKVRCIRPALQVA